MKSIKYTTGGIESNTIKSQNWLMGINDINYSPTPSTDFWSPIQPPNTGYTVYQNKASNGPSIRVAQNDNELITIINQISGNSFSTIENSLEWALSNNILVVNEELTSVNVSDLLLYYDARYTFSYPNGGTSVYDLSGNNNHGTLINSPSSSSISNWNSILFDGTNDYLLLGSTVSLTQANGFTYAVCFDSQYFRIRNTALTQYQILNLSNIQSGIFDMEILSNDKLYVSGGFTIFDNQYNINLVRLNSDGTLDTGFESISTPSAALTVADLFLDDSENLYTAGTNGHYEQAKVDTDGTLIWGGNAPLYYQRVGVDKSNGNVWLARRNSFVDVLNSSGVYQHQITMTGSIYKFISISGGGAYIVGNFTVYDGVNRNNIAKIDSDGYIDTGFDPGTGFNGDVYGGMLDSSGNLVVCGGFTSYDGNSISRIAKIDSSGNLVVGFNPPTINGTVNDLYLDSSDNIFACGTFSSPGINVIKLNSSGTQQTFNTGTGFNDDPTRIRVTSGGKVIVSGTGITSYNGSSTPNYIVRLNSDATLDGTFNTTGWTDGYYRSEMQVKWSGMSNFAWNFNGTPTGGSRLPLADENYMYTPNVITITMSASGIEKTYWNGELETTIDRSATTNNFDIDWLDMGNNFFYLQVYDRELTQTEVLQNYLQSSVEVDGLFYYLDATNPISFTTTGNEYRWYNLISDNNYADLVNTPSWNNPGYFRLNGTDEYISQETMPSENIKNSTVTIIFDDTIQSSARRLFAIGSVFSILWEYNVANQYIRINNVTYSSLPLGILDAGIKFLTMSIDENYQVRFFNKDQFILEEDYSGWPIDYTYSTGGGLYMGVWEQGGSFSQYSQYDYYGLLIWNRALSDEEIKSNYHAYKNKLGI